MLRQVWQHEGGQRGLREVFAGVCGCECGCLRGTPDMFSRVRVCEPGKVPVYLFVHEGSHKHVWARPPCLSHGAPVLLCALVRPSFAFCIGCLDSGIVCTGVRGHDRTQPICPSGWGWFVNTLIVSSPIYLLSANAG